MLELFLNMLRQQIQNKFLMYTAFQDFKHLSPFASFVYYLDLLCTHVVSNDYKLAV